MDRSNSNSEQSNLFVISSDSSRSEHRRRKEGYIRFARRVKDLLDVPGNDLEELYKRVENIVVKYFQEHRVVDFEEMYAHIASLHSNSRKMTQIVNLLENRLCKSSSKPEEGRRSSKTEEFQTTINSHHQRNSLHENVTTNKEDLLNTFSEGYDNVSAKNSFFKPVAKESLHQMTPKANRSKQQSEASPANISPYKHSPSKTNIDEYYSRNKEYESRIKEMMKEINAIKQSIPKQVASASSSNLRIDLRQNEERRLEKEANPSSKQIKQQLEGNDKGSYSKIMDGDRTPSSSYIHQLTNIEGRQKEEKEQLKERVEDKQKTNFQMLLRNAQNITRQINELRQTASSKQIQSSKEVGGSKSESETQILPPQVINEMIRKASEGKNKKPILQQMENTTSQMNISQDMIPSFKHLADHNKQKEIFTTELDVATTKHPVNVSFHQVNPQQGLLSSSQVVNSFQPVPQHPPYNLSTIKYVYNPYPNSVIYPNHSLYIKPQPVRPQLFQPAPLPIQRAPYESKERPYASRQAANRIYLNQMSSPLTSSNNLSTSIMHPHLFTRQRESLSPLNPLEGQRSIINQIPRGSINTIYSSPSSMGSAKSIQSSLNSQSSGSSLQRKGLNLTTHKP